MAHNKMPDESYIEQVVQAYNKIIFDGEILDHVKINDPQILILSTKRFNSKTNIPVFRRVNEETAKKLYALYHTYEFADNFILLDKSSTFATIFNYVQTGILTPEEAWRALLGE